MSSETAIATITGIHTDRRDVPPDHLGFFTEIDQAERSPLQPFALQIVFGNEAIKEFLTAAETSHPHELEGKKCLVETDGTTIKYLGLLV